MIDDINTKRTELANRMAAAGAALLDFTGTAAALAAIPDTEPQQYVAAGTPENIAAILPATITPQRRQKHGERPSAADLEWGDAATSGDAPDLQQLKALALAATPGPWVAGEPIPGAPRFLVADCGPVGKVYPGDQKPSHGTTSMDDAKFIAAANPAVVLDLIARIERASAPAPTEPTKAEVDAEVESYRRGYVEGMEEGARLAVEPATASGDELPSLPATEYKLSADSKAASLYDLEAVQSIQREAYELGKARAAVSAATKPTADLSSLQRWSASRKSLGAMVRDEDGSHYRVADVQSLLATKPAAAPEVPAGAAVDANGTTYHNIAEIYHQAEECEALHMWLDEQGVPRADAEGKVFSPVGRVMGVAQDATRFRWLNSDHDDDGVREQARSLAKRLGTSSYFAITRDIDAAMSSRCRAQGGVTNDTSSGNSAASTTGAAQTAEQVRDAALEEAAVAAEKVQDDYSERQGGKWPELRDDAATGAGDCATAIRALKRPTPTHSSEAGDAK